MMLPPHRFQQLIGEFQIAKLFNEIGWDRASLSGQTIRIGNEEFDLSPVAQKRGVVIFECRSASGSIPSREVMLKIEREAGRIAHEHLLVFTDAKRTTQTWLWVSRSPGQPAVTRSHTWRKGTSGESLRQKLEKIAFTLSEEESITLALASQRLKDAFDRDRVTRAFYGRFESEHQQFSAFVRGITQQASKQWYASLMLNRLMFVYFIQKKGFLDGNVNYLADRMHQLQERAGRGKFHSFYRSFLIRMFHEGLGRAKPRGPELDALLGDIPYLNGGLFDVHELEETFTEIEIPDEAFERLFAFFDSYDWHLDDRPLASGNEINPDVLGYIFEKYINQKEMGAYYTKEDITGYIAANTIIANVLERAARLCEVAFTGAGSIWDALRSDPTRYIGSAQKRGVVDSRGELVPLASLPLTVQAAINNSASRLYQKEFNHDYAIVATSDGLRGLPNETWRDYSRRRSRVETLLAQMKAGAIVSIEQVIAANLDIRQFAQDVIERSAGAELLRAIWQSIVGLPHDSQSSAPSHGLSVLDPTCGSGAFLFAALNILEPLYEACLGRMEDFVAQADAENRPELYQDFRVVLSEVHRHASPRYYTYKSIIVHNLYGVDVMAEAVEICKLRLFLKLVSQVDAVRQLEPLPDIDFNIRTGNSLVGYATAKELYESTNLASDRKQLKEVEDKASALSESFDRFRRQQTVVGGSVSYADKKALRNRLSELAAELDRFLAVEFGIDPTKPKSFTAWKEAHQPFHWHAEFYGVMHGGGFDVIIGNPPYVEVPPTLSRALLIKSFETALPRWSRDEDLYTYIVERSLRILKASGSFGMILPLSLAFSTKWPFVQLRERLMKERGTWWLSHFDRIPSALFGNDVRTRCTIALLKRSSLTAPPGWRGWTTALLRWTVGEREVLFDLVHYARVGTEIGEGIPKLGSELQAQAFEARHKSGHRLQEDLRRALSFSTLAASAPKFPRNAVFVGGVAYNWFPAWREIPNTTNVEGKPSLPARTVGFEFESQQAADCVFALLCSSLGYWWWAVASDAFNLKRWLIDRFPVSLRSFSAPDRAFLAELGNALRDRLRENYVYKENRGRIGNFYLPACQREIDAIDTFLTKTVPGLTPEVMLDIRDFNSSFSTAGALGGDGDESE